jgi:hypothetical protein
MVPEQPWNGTPRASGPGPARRERLWPQLAPRKQVGEIAAVVAVDAVRPRRELVLENAVLRHQVSATSTRVARTKGSTNAYPQVP